MPDVTRAMSMGCAECDCRVEAGKRIETCADANACCCTEVPVAHDAVARRPSPQAGV